ncbi:hypothetical protein [Hyphomonas oceanitis]|uniref:hypothetical protein n=1 Tax=Hyphomonas oceanitis TaxID=81033 RepID=UPI003002FF54
MKLSGMLAVYAVFCVSACAQGAASPTAQCAPYSELLALEQSYSGVYLGELHGTLNSPDILKCFMDARRVSQRHLVLSLEGSGSILTDPEVEASYRQNGAKGMGVLTPPVWALVQRAASDPSLAGVAFQENGSMKATKPLEEWDTADYEAAMQFRETDIADGILAVLAPDTFVVALGGNLHAARVTRNPAIKSPAGSQMPASVATVFLVSSEGGSAHYCTDEGCQEWDVAPQDYGFKPNERLRSGEAYGYDYIFDVGPLKTIPAPE